MDTQWKHISKKSRERSKKLFYPEFPEECANPSMALFMYVVSNCVFSVIFYTTCSQALYLFIHLLTPQMMNCAQESMHEYLLLNELNEPAGGKRHNKSFKKLLTSITNQRGKEFNNEARSVV